MPLVPGQRTNKSLGEPLSELGAALISTKEVQDRESSYEFTGAFWSLYPDEEALRGSVLRSLSRLCKILLGRA